MERSFTPINNSILEGIKSSLDPKNIFAINNTIYRSEKEKEIDLNHKL
jgi:hypothetical protein